MSWCVRVTLKEKSKGYLIENATSKFKQIN